MAGASTLSLPETLAPLYNLNAVTQLAPPHTALPPSFSPTAASLFAASSAHLSLSIRLPAPVMAARGKPVRATASEDVFAFVFCRARQASSHCAQG